MRSYHSLCASILASASPRRAELLTAAGYTFDVHAVDVDERMQRGRAAARVRRSGSRRRSRARALERADAVRADGS